MIKIEHIEISGLTAALRGMRLPMNSTGTKDQDIELAMKLIKSGSDHRKFLRQIFFTAEITGPRFWWAEMDTYKVGTCANSESTMHTIHKNGITHDLFSFESFEDDEMFEEMKRIIYNLEYLRRKYIETKDKKYWYMLIEMLPQSFNQKRQWSANYEVLRNIYHARKNHKLYEWQYFCKIIETIENSEFITCEGTK